MNPNIKLILQRYDEEGSYEISKNFDYDKLEIMAKNVDTAICANGILTTFEGAVYNQDASFSIAIVLNDFKYTTNNIIHLPTIRFSNFGYLSSLTLLELIPLNIQELILTILCDNEFIYIPCDELDSPYDGIMKDAGTFSTWWIRYFDWL